MAERDNEEEVIPLGVVIMSVGFIILLTAGGAFAVITLAPPQTVERILPIAVPTAAPSEADVALLPETPLEGNAGDFISLNEADQSYVTGQPDRLVIPDLNLDAPVVGIGLAQVISEGQIYYQWQVPTDFKVGWHNTSAPLGKAGNTVFNGHHNIYGEVFRDLIDLEEGAEIYVYSQNQVYTYTVSLVELLPERGQSLEVRKENARWIAPTEDERITLVTCWPYEDNSHRLIVVARPTTVESVVTTNAISILEER